MTNGAFKGCPIFLSAFVDCPATMQLISQIGLNKSAHASASVVRKALQENRGIGDCDARVDSEDLNCADKSLRPILPAYENFLLFYFHAKKKCPNPSFCNPRAFQPPKRNIYFFPADFC